MPALSCVFGILVLKAAIGSCDARFIIYAIYEGEPCHERKSTTTTTTM
jgi:hypothetical protein